MLWVLSGNVLIQKDGIEIARAGHGEIVGEMSLIDQSPRSATVIAESECETIEVGREQFLELVRAEPEFALAVMSDLSRKLRKSDSSRVDELEANNFQLQDANDQLYRANAFLEQIIEQSPAGIAILDEQGRTQRLNTSARRILDIDTHSLPESMSQYCCTEGPLHSLRRSEQDIWSGECKIPIASEMRTLYVSISRLAINSSSQLYLMIFEDISQLIELNEQIIKLERLATEGEMAAEIAHHINNYLAVLSGNLELIQHRLERQPDDDVLRWLSAMNQGLSEISRFVDDLMGARRQTGNLEERNIDEMVRVMLRFLGPQKRFRQIKLSAVTAPDFPARVRVNESLFHQVLLNLLINAADALGGCQRDVKSITVELARVQQNSMAQIRVIDNGPGIGPDHLADLFSRRFTTKPTGHGIGLITVKKIVDFHGGSIHCESRPDQGTAFTILLPN
jgi:signal transduction histidine kinase